MPGKWSSGRPGAATELTPPSGGPAARSARTGTPRCPPSRAVRVAGQPDPAAAPFLRAVRQGAGPPAAVHRARTASSSATEANVSDGPCSLSTFSAMCLAFTSGKGTVNSVRSSGKLPAATFRHVFPSSETSTS